MNIVDTYLKGLIKGQLMMAESHLQSLKLSKEFIENQIKFCNKGIERLKLELKELEDPKSEVD